MKTIAFATLKGGVGKTMSAFSIGGILANEGKRVLMIDTDLQGNLSNNLAVDRINNRSFLDIMEELTFELKDVLIKTPIKELPTLDCICSSIYLAETELTLGAKAGRELILKNFFDENKEALNEYDYIILDTNPSMSLINQNALVVSDHVILLTDSDVNSIEGAELFIALWGRIRKRIKKEDNVSALITTRFDKRTKVDNDFWSYIKKHEQLAPLLVSEYVPTNIKLRESAFEAMPINIFDKSSTGAVAYEKIVEDLKKKGVL